MADLLGKKTETEAVIPVEQAPMETPVVVEVAPEVGEAEVSAVPEQAVETPVETVSLAPEAAPPSAPVAATTPAITKDPMTAQIEEIMAEDLTDAFLNLPADKQEAFKAKGEETAGKIRAMIESAKVNAKKIFDMIKDWLKMIPGVNKFFLEQEAKIKTDKILKLKP